MSEEQEQQQQGQFIEADCASMMDEILEKLRLLDYERNFLAQKGHKPLNNAYFSQQLNSNEQFSYFKSLVQWLFKLNEVSTTDQSKYDDPNTVSQNILAEVKKLGIPSDFAPLKLKQGFGEHVCFVILQLLNRAIKVKKFPWNRKPKFQEGGNFQDEPDVEEEGDANLDLAENLDESEENEMDENIDGADGPNQIDEEHQVIESKIDQKEWILECERVSSKLKFTVKSNAKEWRAHVESSKNFNSQIVKILPGARSRLEKLSDELSKVLDDVARSEKNINVSMNDMGTEYKSQAEEFKRIGARYNQLNQIVKDLGEQYRTISEKYEVIKNKTTESDVTDHSPLMKIKAAIQKIRADIKNMDLRIGVLNHTVIQHKFKQKKQKEDKRESGLGHMTNHIDDLDDE